MTEAIIGLLILGPVIITYFLKSNAALGFLSICAGSVVGMFVILDLQRLIDKFNVWVDINNLNVLLLTLPLALTLLFTRKANTKGIKRILQLITALFAGGLLAILVVPSLALQGQHELVTSSLWQEVQKVQPLIVGIGAGLSLVMVWLAALKKAGKTGKHKS